MTYEEVLERYLEQTSITHAEYTELCKDFEAWRTGPDGQVFFEQRNRILLIGVKFDEGGVNLWLTRITSSYDWEDAEIDARIQERATKVLDFLRRRTSVEAPSIDEIESALGMEQVYVIESLDALIEDGKVNMAAPGIYAIRH